MSALEQIDKIITYNIKLLSKIKVKFCNENPSHPSCVVVPNTYDKWVEYAKTHYEVVFEKGMERLETWKCLLNNQPFLYFKKNPTYSTTEPDYNNSIPKLKSIKERDEDAYYFILAAFIIILQVFSDGNHRTATYFYNKFTGNVLSELKLKEIDKMRRNNPFDYYNLKQNPNVIRTEIIPKLLEINKLTNGGFKKKSRTKKTRRQFIKKTMRKKIIKRKNKQ